MKRNKLQIGRVWKCSCEHRAYALLNVKGKGVCLRCKADFPKGAKEVSVKELSKVIWVAMIDNHPRLVVIKKLRDADVEVQEFINNKLHTVSYLQLVNATLCEDI